MHTLRGCLFRLVLYALMVTAVAAVVERRIGQSGPSAVAGLIGGVIAARAFLYLAQAVRKSRELMLIRSGLAGAEPRDGKRFAAIGPITPSGGARLVSPLTHTAAIAYNYQIAIGLTTWRWEGLALVPSTIRCGLQSIRLLAFPELVDFPKERLSGAAVQHAEEYVLATDFQPVRSNEASIATIMDELYSVYRDGDGSVRQDRGKRTEKRPSLTGALLTEQVLRPHDTVCAIGVYSTQHGGLVADPKAVRHSVTIEKAEPGRLVLRRVTAAGRALMNAVIALAIVMIALAALYIIVPLDSVERSDVSWLEIGLEDVIDDHLRTPLVQAGMPMLPPPEPGAELIAGQARGRIRYGVQEASVGSASAQWHQGYLAVYFFEETAVVGAISISPAGGLGSLRIFSEDISYAEGQVARLSVVRLAGDNEMAGRLSWVRDGVPVCRVVFRVAVPAAEPR